MLEPSVFEWPPLIVQCQDGALEIDGVPEDVMRDKRAGAEQRRRELCTASPESGVEAREICPSIREACADRASRAHASGGQRR